MVIRRFLKSFGYTAKHCDLKVGATGANECKHFVQNQLIVPAVVALFVNDGLVLSDLRFKINDDVKLLLNTRNLVAQHIAFVGVRQSQTLL